MANGRRDAAKGLLWRQALAKFAASELSVRRSCLQESLREPTFHAWRRELARRREQLSDGSVTPTFVPLVVNNRTTVIKTMQQPQAPVVANSGDSGPPIWLILLGLLALAPAWFVLKRAGGMAQRKIMPLRCSTHNVSYQPGTVCPRCAAESSSSIGGRLRRFSVEQPAPEPGAGASAERERRAS